MGTVLDPGKKRMKGESELTWLFYISQTYRTQSSLMEKLLHIQLLLKSMVWVLLPLIFTSCLCTRKHLLYSLLHLQLPLRRTWTQKNLIYNVLVYSSVRTNIYPNMIYMIRSPFTLFLYSVEPRKFSKCFSLSHISIYSHSVLARLQLKHI